MRSRGFRPTAAMLGIVLFAGTPVYAGPVVVREVAHFLSDDKKSVSLRLRTTHEGSSASTPDVKEARHNGAAGAPRGVGISDDFDSLLPGISLAQDPKIYANIVGQEDVDGTICDCGEILVAGSSFKKWPLLFLAAVPLVFISRDSDGPETPISIPTPITSTSTSVPEPTTLFLFGGGLAAIGVSLRRRCSKKQSRSQAAREES